MIGDLYLSNNLTKQKVYVVIEERTVPYESTDRTIRAVCTSFKKADEYCKEHPLSSVSRYVKISYDIEEHEVQ